MRMVLHDRSFIEELQEFYINCLALSRENLFEELRQEYLRMCGYLQERIPVSITAQPSTIEADLSNRSNLIVVANHIQTPDLFQLKGDDFFDRAVLAKGSHFLELINPIILRHFPLVNFMMSHNLPPYFVTGSHLDLNLMLKGWGGMSIDLSMKNNLERIIEKYAEIPKPKSMLLFPEGCDSQGDLLRSSYRLMRFRKGFAVLAQQLHLPVLPISLSLRFEPLRYDMYVHPMMNVGESEDPAAVASSMQALVASGIKSNNPINLILPFETE